MKASPMNIVVILVALLTLTLVTVSCGPINEIEEGEYYLNCEPVLYTSEIEANIKTYMSGIGSDIVVEPVLAEDILMGFNVRPRYDGAEYAGMDEDICNLGNTN